MTDSTQADGTPSALDPLSTSQKICIYKAPFIAVIQGEKGAIIQACCNHWDCPRCGEMRAKHEYGRIVNGAKIIGESHTLYFYTFTCRGKSLSLETAQRDYLLWTNRLLSTMRARAKAEGGFWCYVQVTERQKRGHPHSHLLMCWLPGDAIRRMDSKGKPYYYSKWFNSAHSKSGLGTQSRVTPVASVEAVSRYIAKYLFKDAQFTLMPKGWKRVRYSQNFPKALERQVDETSITFPLLKHEDWRRAELSGATFACEDMAVWAIARKHVRKVVRGWV